MDLLFSPIWPEMAHISLQPLAWIRDGKKICTGHNSYYFRLYGPHMVSLDYFFSPFSLLSTSPSSPLFISLPLSSQPLKSIKSLLSS
jgi:hypothetical protein